MAAGRTTIKDVAREAGVSISTVSNALNDVDVLLPETKQRVLDAAARLNYAPDLNGRNLKAKATKVLGLFITAIRGPYYGTLSDAIYSACRANGYELQIFLSQHTRTIMTNLLGRRVDGAIILNELVNSEQEKLLKENGVPVVFIDRRLKDEHISSVVFDSRHEGELAAKYLLELGHKNLIYVAGIDKNFDNIERRAGFETVLKRSGIRFTEDNLLSGEFEHDKAYQSTTEYLDSGKPLPDAIFAANDLSAMGVIEALIENGVRVPEDVSVIGCDDIETAKMVSPSITTIRTNFEKQGTTAVEELIRLINGGEGTVSTLNGRIIPRESTLAKD